MPYLTGAGLALATWLLARMSRLDRDGALYPVILIVIACYYDLFAAIDGRPSALMVEAGITAIFLAIALVGFRRSPWVIVVGLALHGLLDAWHSQVVDDAGVPVWWPAFCLTFDLVAAASLALTLTEQRSRNSDSRGSRPVVHSAQGRNGAGYAAGGATKTPLLLLGFLALTATASVWATKVGARPIQGQGQQLATSNEKIAPYHARFGRLRPVVAIVGENGATELTDFAIPYGILARAAVADLVTVSTKTGPMTMRPALRLQADTTTGTFDEQHPDGADYVVVPMVVKSDDRTLLEWILRQSARGATIVSICDGALVVANTGLLNGHRATAHWATLSYRRKHFPKVTWVENTRYVADGEFVSSAGISAAIPTTLALVEAIAGRGKAQAIADEIGVAEWSTRHDSQVFAPAFGRNLTALAATHAINPSVHREEKVGLKLENGIDEIALAFMADAYSRTGRSKALGVGATLHPVRTRGGLLFLPERTSGDVSTINRMVPIADVKPGIQLDRALAAIQRDYGRFTAFSVALEFEYPGFE